jgi:hypothetical protein
MMVLKRVTEKDKETHLERGARKTKKRKRRNKDGFCFTLKMRHRRSAKF